MSTEAPTAPITDTPAAPAATPPPNGGSGSPQGNGGHSSGVSEPWAKEWIAPDFTLKHSALDRLPDHLKGLRPVLERQKTFEDVLTVMQNQQVLNGKKALAPLPSDAPSHVQAERKTLLDTINGVPPTPKDYGLGKPADLPDAQWHQPMADSFAAWAHKHSVSPGAAKEMLNIQANFVKEQLVGQQQQEEQFWSGQQQLFESTIKRENIPTDRASALVEKGALALGLDLNNEQTKIFLKGSDARLMAMRHAIAIGEDRTPTGATGGGDRDPGALAKAAMSDPADPLYAQYWNREGKFSRSVQEAAVARVNGWLQQAEAKNSSARPGRR